MKEKRLLGCPVRCARNPECLRGECVWLAEYLARQRWINAFAGDKGPFRYAHPEEYRSYLQKGPCGDCPVEKVCDMPCPEYVKWWDLRMDALRKEVR